MMKISCGIDYHLRPLQGRRTMGDACPGALPPAISFIPFRDVPASPPGRHTVSFRNLAALFFKDAFHSLRRSKNENTLRCFTRVALCLILLLVAVSICAAQSAPDRK